MEFVNFFTSQSPRPRACLEAFVLMLAPLAPHVAEELWRTLGRERSLAHAPWPAYEEALTRDDTVDLVVQLDGKVRSRITLPADASAPAIEAAALADSRVRQLLGGRAPKKVIVVPGRLVNIVAG